MGGLKTGPSRRHRIQPAEGPFLDPRAKETCFKKGSESGPLEIKSGPPVIYFCVACLHNAFMHVDMTT